MQVKLIVLCVRDACTLIGMEWRDRQRLKAFEAGQVHE